MHLPTTQDRTSRKLRKLQNRLRRLHKALQDRTKRLDYFMNEGVGDKIVVSALTSVEEAKADIDSIRKEMAELRQKQENLNGSELN